MNNSTDNIFPSSGSGYPSLGAGMRRAILDLRSSRERHNQGLFVVEGNKAVGELLRLFKCQVLVATFAWLEANAQMIPSGCKVFQAKKADFERISSLSSVPSVMAVFEMPKTELDIDKLNGRLIVALDDIQDPGNLGTIIRACDWYGVTDILCSEHTVDAFHPKVIQSTMGAIGRVNIHYCDLQGVLEELSATTPVYGTFLDGENIYRAELPVGGAVIVMGNEGHGISADVAETINRRLYIPPFPADKSHVESLNVAMATSITLSEFRRRQFTH